MAKGDKRKVSTIKTVNMLTGRANPFPSLPPGGKPGDVLVKTHYPDGEVDWEPVEQNPYKHRAIPLGYLLSAWVSSSDRGYDKNQVGYFQADQYCFTNDSFGNHSYSDGKWRTWLDPDSDIAKYVKELGQDLIGATIVGYPQHKASTWFYGGPQRGRIDKVTISTTSNGLMQLLLEVHDETERHKWTKPEAHNRWSLPFSDMDGTESRYSANYWSDYESGTPTENLVWFIERQSDLLTRADSAGWYQVFRAGAHKMLTPISSDSTFDWQGTYYGNPLMSWKCKVGGTSGTYGTFSLAVNAYATGTTLYCPQNSVFDVRWNHNNSRTEFAAGSIKINGSSVSRSADLLAVAKASKDAEDLRARLIAFLEEIVERDEGEAKAVAAIEENPPEAVEEVEQLPEDADE